MGFSIYYRSTRPVSPERQRAISESTDALNERRTWLSCEPVHFFDNRRDGHLFGGSKLNVFPHPDDAASAARMQSPDGTMLADGTARDVVDILGRLSQDYGIDWELSHDYDPNPIGFIRDGVAQERLLQRIGALADLPGILDDMRVEIDDTEDEDDWEDDEPSILPFRPRD